MAAQARLTPWPGATPPTEADLRGVYAAESLSPYTWGNGPGDSYAPHTHSYDKVLYCVRGSIVFTVSGRRVTMTAGDRLDLPAGTPHGALVGPDGVTCLEAHH